MGKFTLSVIVPNYNNEKYIRQCLDSILAQTYPVKELIVYDDCSTGSFLREKWVSAWQHPVLEPPTW